MEKQRILRKRQRVKEKAASSKRKPTARPASAKASLTKAKTAEKQAQKQATRHESDIGRQTVKAQKKRKRLSKVDEAQPAPRKQRPSATSYKRKKHPSKKVASVNRKRRPSTHKKGVRPVLRDILLAVVLGGFLLSAIVSVSFRFPKMDGYAMMTTLNDRDRLIVNKWKEAKRFSLIYFQEPGKKTYTIRRVIGLPGEEIAYKNDELYVDHQLVPERFLQEAREAAKKGGYLLMADLTIKQLTGDSRIPEDSYFVLGDNRQFATDSRSYGLVKKDQLVGVVELRLLPFHTARYF